MNNSMLKYDKKQMMIDIKTRIKFILLVHF